MQQSLEEILRAKMAVPVSIKGRDGATVMFCLHYEIERSGELEFAVPV